MMSRLPLIVLCCLSCLTGSVLSDKSSCRRSLTTTTQAPLEFTDIEANNMCWDLGYYYAYYYRKEDCKIYCFINEGESIATYAVHDEQCKTKFMQDGTCIHGICFPGPKDKFNGHDFVPIVFNVTAVQLPRDMADFNCDLLLHYVSSPGADLKPFNYNDELCNLTSTNPHYNNYYPFEKSCTFFPIHKKTKLMVSIHKGGILEPDCRREIQVDDILDKGGREMHFACREYKVWLEISTLRGKPPEPERPPWMPPKRKHRRRFRSRGADQYQGGFLPWPVAKPKQVEEPEVEGRGPFDPYHRSYWRQLDRSWPTTSDW